MKSKKKIRNPKSKFDKIIAILIGVILIVLFTAGYAMSFFDSVIAPVIKYDTNIISDRINKNISFDSNFEEEVPIIDIEKALINNKQSNTEETGLPTINIESINAEYKDHPDYDTYEINISEAYYIEEVDGEKIKKAFPIKTGGTISIKREKNEEQSSEEKEEQNGEEKKDTKKVPIINPILEDDPNAEIFKGILSKNN
ncbi:MAG: hypothetical protein GX800_09985 [Clostridiaceae bacterium]|nr:hypothetical protein [Clostridiaceae bacterium]